MDVSKIAKTTGILLAGLFLGWLIFGGTPSEDPQPIEDHIEEAHTDEEGNIVYTCSMHPSIRESEPGNCPICGMELIPVSQSQDTAVESPYEFTMSKAAMQLAEVQTTEVVSRPATHTIRMPGKIAVDERRISSVTSHFPGRIKQLYVDFTGQRVEKGQKLASIYSPQLLTAQRELIEAYRKREQNPSLYEASRRKLRLWELPEETINELERSGNIMTELDIVAPAEGYVLKRNISVEDHVMEGTVMYQIANLSRLWVRFNAYESDLAGLSVGDQVRFQVDAYPGETFDARISFIDPVLDPGSRTANIRAEAPNHDNRLKPQMLAEGVITSDIAGGRPVLQIPKSAVLWTGERSVVYVRKPDTKRPTFEFREVELGQRAGDYYVVKSGLRAGEEVVTHGNFKLDSAAQLAGKASMMNRNPDGRVPAVHDHGTMDRDNGSNPPAGSHGQQENPQPEETHQHEGHLSELVGHYLEIKTALTQDNLVQAKASLSSFSKEVTQNPEMTDHDEHSTKHAAHHAAMVQAVQKAENSDNIASFRSAFATISRELLQAIENQRTADRELYLQYCPMAFDGKGGRWISDSKEISNPYMGKHMPGCGETSRRIETD